MQTNRKHLIVACLFFVFLGISLKVFASDLPKIFDKNLRAHDESSNSVVTANITRKFFPPMVRVNPLNETQGNWMEGPYWQHIPPMFAYVPYLFYLMDGQISIEVKRLSFAALLILSGGVFILSVYLFNKSLKHTFAAFLASVLWIMTPFTRDLVTGIAFGVSDIVLAFSAVGAFGGIIWYLKEPLQGRLQYSLTKLGIIAILVALPLMAKNLLGAIPATIYFIFLLHDNKFSAKILTPISLFIFLIFTYYFSLYLSSPETFVNEIFLALFHADNFEGWGRPWYFYITIYLPQNYLGKFVWLYFASLILGLYLIIRKETYRAEKILLTLSLGWFVWNLIAVSLIESKIANFIFQSYLFGLFAGLLSLLILGNKIKVREFKNDFKYKLWLSVLALSVIFAAGTFYQLYQEIKISRAAVYEYDNELERFYRSAEQMSFRNIGVDDLSVINVSNYDCWFRYYILFLSGAESKTILEIYFMNDNVGELIKSKYKKMYFVTNKTEEIGLPNSNRIELDFHSLIEFDLNTLSIAQINALIKSYIVKNKVALEKEIERTKADKLSCQWLVPDEILNAS